MVRINVIGAGRVGQTLIKLIEPLSEYKLGAICSKHFLSHTTPVVPTIAELPHADLFLLTVPDQLIEKIAALVCQYHSNTILIHCSAALPAQSLNRENRPDIQVASVHPPLCMADPTEAARMLSQGFCCIEGDDPAIQQVTPLFQAFGSTLYPIDPSKKVAYHAANVLLGNYLVTLTEATYQQLTGADIDSHFAKKIIAQLIQSTTENLKKSNAYSDALTGPIARGDIETVKKHIQALKPELKSLYCSLAEQTLELTRLDDSIKESIRSLFQNEIRD